MNPSRRPRGEWRRARPEGLAVHAGRRLRAALAAGLLGATLGLPGPAAAAEPAAAVKAPAPARTDGRSVQRADPKDGIPPYPPAVAALHRQAVAGEAQARYDLGIVLLCGRWVPRDAPTAGLWMALASAQDHEGAQSVFGWQLMTGTGVRRDDLHAVHWLTRAAETGDTAAQNNLGVSYALGHGVPRDRALAERWFQAAADQGAEEAARNLAVLRGDGPASAPRSTLGGGHPRLSQAACAAPPRAPARHS